MRPTRTSSEAMARRANEIFLVARDAQHHRAIVELARKQCRYCKYRIRGTLGTESTTAVFGDEHEIFDRYADGRGHAWRRETLTLSRRVQVTLTVFPVGHARAWLHAMMRDTLGDERFVEYERCIGKPGIYVAI